MLWAPKMVEGVWDIEHEGRGKVSWKYRDE